MKLAQIQALYEAITVSKVAEKSEDVYKLVFSVDGTLYSGIPLEFNSDYATTIPVILEVAGYRRKPVKTIINENDDSFAVIKARNSLFTNWYGEDVSKEFIYSDPAFLLNKSISFAKNIDGLVVNMPFTDIDLIGTDGHLDFMYIPEDAEIIPLSLIKVTSES